MPLARGRSSCRRGAGTPPRPANLDLRSRGGRAFPRAPERFGAAASALRCPGRLLPARGLDSSAIVCLMSGQMGSDAGGSQVNTVSACYAEKSVDEAVHGCGRRACAYAAAFRLSEGRGRLQRASDITWHQDEPFRLDLDLRAMVRVRGGPPRRRQGDAGRAGADEQLAGYHGGFSYYMAALTRQPPIRPAPAHHRRAQPLSRHLDLPADPQPSRAAAAAGLAGRCGVSIAR